MKKLVFSMLAMAAMVSYTSESDPISEITDGDKVEIKLNAGVIDVKSKAAINPVEAAFSNATVPLVRMEGTASPTWTSATTSNSEDATIDGTTVTLATTQKYYPADAATNVYFIGYYPTTSSSFDKGIVSYTNLTGEQDIICTNETSVGNKQTPQNATLSFNHMLSQVEIQVKGDVAAQTAFGNITKVELIGIPTNLDLTIGTSSKIGKNTTTPNLQPITIFEATQALTTDYKKVGAIPMIVPGLGKSGDELTLKITTATGGESTVKINNIAGGLTANQKHVIKLDFKEKIAVTSSIEPWDLNGAGGTGEVD